VTIPPSLAPFFQEYDIAKLNPQRDSHTIIERVLQFGNRAELRWLFTVYSLEQIKEWGRQFGKDKLPQLRTDSALLTPVNIESTASALLTN
jgi:hypothetical protein